MPWSTPSVQPPTRTRTSDWATKYAAQSLDPSTRATTMVTTAPATATMTRLADAIAAPPVSGRGAGKRASVIVSPIETVQPELEIERAPDSLRITPAACSRVGCERLRVVHSAPARSSVEQDVAHPSNRRRLLEPTSLRCLVADLVGAIE